MDEKDGEAEDDDEEEEAEVELVSAEAQLQEEEDRALALALKMSLEEAKGGDGRKAAAAAAMIEVIDDDENEEEDEIEKQGKGKGPTKAQVAPPVVVEEAAIGDVVLSLPDAPLGEEDMPLLGDFLAACQRAKFQPTSGDSPFRIRDRASRLLRRALLRRR